ncbi:MAG TPA: polysaccharide deacetylase family protein, partial [Gemmatimonadaceae bacterium]|nr:polysaccharide deacetylase family protein [Gemmatimonadaceae bacterium]
AGSPSDFLLPELTVFVDPAVHGVTESLKRHASQITTVALLGLQLGEDGTLIDHLDRNMLRLAHDEGLRTVVVVQNLDRDSGQWQPERVRSLARDRAARTRLAEELVRLCEAERLQGAHLAFDGLRDWRDLEPLAMDVGRRLRRAQLDLLIDVPPGVDGDALKSLAQHTSGVVVMAFDEYDAGSPAGPVASDAFVESALRSASAHIPAAKLTAALAAHGYEWITGAPGRRISFDEAHALARNAQVALRRSSDNLHAQFRSGEQRHELWIGDAASIERQSSIARAAGIRALALSTLGGEDPDVWRALHEGLATRAANSTRTRTPSVTPAIAAEHDKSDGANEPNPLRTASPPNHEESLEIAITNDLALSRHTGGAPPTQSSTRVAGRRPPFVQDRPVDDERGMTLSAPFSPSRTPPAEPKQVALIFVDGPRIESTPAILDALRHHHLAATFFVTGTQSLRMPDLVERIFREGHELGNATFTRPRIDQSSQIGATRLRLELETTSRLIELIVGRRPRLARANAASPTALKTRMLTALGYIENIATREKPLVANTDQEIIRESLEQADSLGVIVIPDKPAAAAMLPRVLPQLIAQLSNRGFRLVPLSRVTGLQRDDIMPHAPDRTRLGERVTQLVLSIALMISRCLPTILWLPLGLLATRAVA